MKLLLDTANLDDIRYYTEFFPILGVTTNPTILSRETKDALAQLEKIRETIGGDRMLHVQVTAETAEKMAVEGKIIREYFGDNTCIKVPFCDEGVKATSLLADAGIKVTETAIFTPTQAMIAANAGASFVAPFVSRLENSLQDGIKTVADIRSIFSMSDVTTEIIAASFKTSLEVMDVALAGAQYATVSPAVLKFVTCHNLNDAARASFRADWKNNFGEKTLGELINEKK